MDKRIEYSNNRFKILEKNGYSIVDIEKQTILTPDGKCTKIPSWEVDRLIHKHNYQKNIRGCIN